MEGAPDTTGDERPGGAETPRSPLTPRDVVGALPAVSAITVGGLYGLGVFLSVTQLVGAHVSVSDTLPLIPLQDHLAKALAAVFTSPALGVVVLGAFIAALWIYASSRSYEQRARSLTSTLARAEELIAATTRGQFAQEREQMLADWESVGRDAEALGDVKVSDSRAAPIVRRMEELSTRSEALASKSAATVEQVRQVTEAARAESDELERRANRQALFVRRAERSTRYVAAGVFVLAFFTPVDIILSPILLGFLVLFARRIIPHHALLFPVLAILSSVVPFVISGYVNPTPLPVATIDTAHGTVKGGLIVSNGDRFVLTRRHNSYVSIPSSEARSVTVEKRKRDRKESVFEILVTSFR